jgi:alkylation response protein AidB-like acyl-CoA dehydrogenase
MQLELGPELEAFRLEVRAFIRSHLPAEMAARIKRVANPTPDEDGLAWLAILAERGWSVPHWPIEHGGTGWTALQQFVFEDECHQADAPVPAWQGTHMCGPVVYTFGTDEQKARFLEPIRKGEHLWAQGFSEPSAGSDLASLRTSARRDGDHYIVNGQKIWTSGAYHAHWGFFLVRTNTDVKPQAGISFLLIDLASPGITIRRIPQVNGDAHVCEVFLDDVRVPVDNRVGAEGAGWSCAKYLLDHERTASSFIYWSKRELTKAVEIARRETSSTGASLLESPLVRDKLARLEAQLLALEWSVLRVLSGETFARPVTAVASGLKIRGAELQQAITELQVELLGGLGLRAWPYERILDGEDTVSPGWPDYVAGKTANFLLARAASIYGGSLQVQKNIIAKLAFGL